MLSVQQITKYYGDHLILQSATFSVSHGDRVGIVGINGSGKSTLLRIIVGNEPADSGKVTLMGGKSIGYLQQAIEADPQATISSLIASALGGIYQMELRMHELEDALATNTDHYDEVLAEYGTVMSAYQDSGGYDLEARTTKVLAGLGSAHLPLDRTVNSLSGGEKARIGLATLLLRSPDILLLDEPTNHLDVAMLEWLESYLSSYAGGVVVVSHDRQFLNRTVTRIHEIDEYTHQLHEYSGNYDAFLAAKQQQRQDWENHYLAQQEEIKELQKRVRETARQLGHNRPAKDNDKSAYNAKGEFVDRAVARNVRSADVLLARIMADPIPRPPKPLQFKPEIRFDPLRSQVILHAEHVTKRFGDRDILRDVTLRIEGQTRIMLTGPNGAGKTTLLALLLGLQTPDSGTIELAKGVRVGYLRQEPTFDDVTATVQSVFSAHLDGTETNPLAGLLGSGLFRIDDMTKQIKQLSQGQQQKLEIGCIIEDRPNMLILDEPTNAISLDVLEAFEQAILTFTGPVIAVSHDRWFIQRFGGEVWNLEEGVLTRIGE